MKLPLLENTPRVFSLAPIVLVALSVSACDGQATLVVNQAGAGEVSVPAVATQGAADVVLADTSPDAIAADDSTDVVQLSEAPVSVQERLSEIAENGSIRLMPMGDSITQGVGGAKSYRFELNNMIAEAGCAMNFVGSQSANKPATDFYKAHEGYSGHAADAFISGSREANAGVVAAVGYQKPDAVLLHVGSVDIWRGDDIASTLTDIDQIIAAIESTKPGTLVLVANLIPWLSTADGADKPGLVLELGNQIEAYVSESNNPNLHLVDVRAGYSADSMQKDMIHPNEQGDAHIADAFFDHLYSSEYCG